MSGKSDKQNLRKEYILSKLREDGKVSIEKLSKELNVTSVTMRKDLNMMEEEGLLMRVSGGAALRPEGSPSYTSKKTTFLKEKIKIANAIAKTISDGETLFIGTGTTCLEIAKALRDRHSLSIVTTSLDVASILKNVSDFRVVLLGGELNPEYGFTYGSDTLEQISHYRTDWSILSIDGISTGGGVTNCHSEEAPIDRMMIANSKRVIVAADHSKVGNAGFYRVCDISDELMLITDSDADRNELAAIASAGARVVTV
ncbi:MAG: DeoR/GlpR transcriptional regulator [Lachnospiraceae bacterium]|nr:DeoR/GlpR transcriptional regulator [Lachnospiraceae bacterium]